MEEARTRYEHYSALFGMTVDVTVNRPMDTEGGSRHSRKRYPINCGYLTHTLTAEGPGENAYEPYYQYVYILGVDHPVETFRGNIIAVLHREGFDSARQRGVPYQPIDRWDRLVIAPEGMEFYEPQIRGAVAFAEHRGGYKLYCMYEKSCGAVLYAGQGEDLSYLLVKNRSGHIGFPKGHVEFGENELATMKREIFEETSLSVEPDLTFREEYRYVLWGVVHKTAVYSIARFAPEEQVHTMENEIFGYWVLPYEEARKLLSYENDRRILDHAHALLTGAQPESTANTNI